MNAVFAQASRLGRLETVLGHDTLVLQRFTGEESLNGLFEWQVDCLATTPDIDFDALIGTHATVTLVTRKGDRAFDGVVTEAEWLGAGENGLQYRLKLRPWFYLASLRRNQRIFHNKTVVEILTELLSAYVTVGALRTDLTADYPALEYTVQYRESDLAFACRMMERHGISYHFRHRNGAHDMVLTDAIDAHLSVGAYPFHPDDGHHQEDIEHFWVWQPARRITTGAIRLTDYNFKTPTAAMEVDQTGDAAYAEGKLESFDWPGAYLDQRRGRVVARLRTDAERGQDRRYEAFGDIAALGAGGQVTLTGDKVPGTGEAFLCLRATHSYTSNNYGSGGASSDGYAYSGRCILAPSTAPVMPELKTPRADVKGPQTAVVVGEGEIDCDEYGRILVRFHWDLANACSMRCRVSQNWAGNSWGGMVIPRIGMEVLVEFLDGDPDQPLVTGCVYNGRNKVPYDLPKHKTRSTFKTDTHQGKGYNELRFEDENNREEIFVHAQKDRNEKIRNNHTERIDNNWVQSIGHNKAIQVRHSHDEVVGGNMTVQVGSINYDSVVTEAMNAAPEGIRAAAPRLDKPVINAVGSGIYTLLAEKAIFETSLGMRNLSVGLVNSSHAGLTQNISAGRMIQLSGAESVAINGGGDIAVQSGGEITITCGAASIILNADGDVRIAGRNLHLDFSGDAEINAEGKLTLDAAETEQNADGNFKINATRVDIN
jgi:type VI secretion system secreted protein VgrG